MAEEERQYQAWLDTPVPRELVVRMADEARRQRIRTDFPPTVEFDFRLR
jgi:hypothetical protein